jgi:nucleoporin GLE1
MSGILTLYLAILHTLPSPNLLPPAPPSTSHPPYPPYSPELIPPHFRLTAGWSWLAAILRPPLPLLEHSPEFMVIFIEVLGGRMLAVYGRQTVKVLHVLLAASRAEGPQALGSGKNVPATARLRLKLEAWESSGVLKEIEGSEPSLD